MNILVITDPGQIGGNFLAWTIYWLSGQQKYWYWKVNKHLMLPENPLTNINAHNFRCPVVWSHQTANDILETLTNWPCDEINCIYLHKFEEDDQDKNAYYIDKFFHWADKVVYVDISPKHHLYFSRYEGRVLRYTRADPSKRHENFDQQFQEFIDTYFLESHIQWNHLGQQNKWDQREFLALNLRPFDSPLGLNHLMSGREYFYLDSRDLWTQLDGSVESLFNFFELPLQQDLFKDWRTIYMDWRKVHHNRIIFGWYFDRIIQNILHGNSMDLSRFDLDIVQEACIQHVLIYNYGLNLKTWQLDKFNNTKQLHDLLEPNRHKIIPYDAC
jgi:hypothetical protein